MEDTIGNHSSRSDGVTTPHVRVDFANDNEKLLHVVVRSELRICAGGKTIARKSEHCIVIARRGASTNYFAHTRVRES